MTRIKTKSDVSPSCPWALCFLSSLCFSSQSMKTGSTWLPKLWLSQFHLQGYYGDQITPHHRSGRESYLWWAMIKHKQSPDYRSKSPHDITVCTTAFTITVYSQQIMNYAQRGEVIIFFRIRYCWKLADLLDLKISETPLSMPCNFLCYSNSLISDLQVNVFRR